MIPKRLTTVALLLLMFARTATAEECVYFEWRRNTYCSRDGGCPADDRTYAFASEAECRTYIHNWNAKEGSNLPDSLCAPKRVNGSCSSATAGTGSFVQNVVEGVILLNPQWIPTLFGAFLIKDLLTPDKAAEQQKAERERQRQLELARQQELERQAAAEKARQDEEKKNELLKNMKGVTPGTPLTPKLLAEAGPGPALKLGDKPGPAGTRDAVADKVPIVAPQRVWRDVDTAWKQLHCAAEIGIMAADSRNGYAETREYASESLKALDGAIFGRVGCSPAPPMPRSSPDIGEASSSLGRVMTEVVAAADEAAKNPSAPRVAERVEAAKEKAAALTVVSEKMQDPVIKKAVEEQRKFKEQDDTRIKKVFEEQKANEQKIEEREKKGAIRFDEDQATPADVPPKQK